jgi:hypothetical protein
MCSERFESTSIRFSMLKGRQQSNLHRGTATTPGNSHFPMDKTRSSLAKLQNILHVSKISSMLASTMGRIQTIYGHPDKNRLRQAATAPVTPTASSASPTLPRHRSWTVMAALTQEKYVLHRHWVDLLGAKGST